MTARLAAQHELRGLQSNIAPVEAEANEPVFHADWEKRVLAMNLTASRGRWNIDAGRHAIERIPGPDYLRMTYYEKWFTSLSALLLWRAATTSASASRRRPTPAPRCLSSTAIE